MCSLVGWGCACRSAVQASSIPAVQKPHCAAPRRIKDSRRVSSARTSPRHGWPLIWNATGIMDPVYTASAMSLPPVGTHGLGQCAAEEHSCEIRFIGRRSMQIIDWLQDLRVVALGLPEELLALS